MRNKQVDSMIMRGIINIFTTSMQDTEKTIEKVKEKSTLKNRREETKIKSL